MIGKIIFKSVASGVVIGLAIEAGERLYNTYIKVKEDLKAEENKKEYEDEESEEPSHEKDDVQEDVVVLNPVGPTKEPYAYNKVYSGATITRVMSDLETPDEERNKAADEVEDILEKNTEGRIDVRVDKNSEEALEMFKSYTLRTVDRSSLRVMYTLFKIPYVPQPNNEDWHDDNLMESLLEKRRDYFDGDCHWVDKDQISMAEVVIHYAEMGAEDLEWDAEDILADILENCFQYEDENGAMHFIDTADVDEYFAIADALNCHDFDGTNGFGLFGIPDGDVDPTVNSYLKEYNIYIGWKLDAIAAIENEEYDI